jgi:hypothetical protein
MPFVDASPLVVSVVTAMSSAKFDAIVQLLLYSFLFLIYRSP